RRVVRHPSRLLLIQRRPVADHHIYLFRPIVARMALGREFLAAVAPRTRLLNQALVVTVRERVQRRGPPLAAAGPATTANAARISQPTEHDGTSRLLSQRPSNGRSRPRHHRYHPKRTANSACCRFPACRILPNESESVLVT